jgi:adhesin/invasin
MKRPANSSGVWSGASKWLTWILTTAAALTALLVNARNLGLTNWFGAVDLSFADHAAYRVVVTPRADSLYAVGDTAILAATVTDRRGAVLTGAQLRWHSEDSNVVAVDSAGTVVARGPGRALVTVTVRDLTAGAMLSVLQRPARVLIAGDSTLKIRQGDTMQLAAIALDARGHRIANAAPLWHTGDSVVATVDSLGTAIGRSAGHTRLWAAVGQGGAEVSVEVELTATLVAVVSGDGQRALADRRLAEPIVVRALARGGQPVPGTSVSFTTADGEGQVEPTTGVADREGRVRVNWTLSPHPGPQRLIARIASTDSIFTVAAEAEPVPGNTRVELVGAMPAGRAGLTLEQPVTLRFTDSTGTALVGVPVTWTLLDGGAIDAAARTDSLGGATARWTLAARAGRQRLLAQVGNPRAIPPFTVTAIAEARAPAAVAVVGGMGQRAPAGKALPKPVTLMLRDSLGNGIAGVALTARTAQGALSETMLTTNPQGRATLHWTLGPTAGDQVVEVRMEGLDSVTRVIAHAAAGAPAKVTVISVPPTKGTTGSALGLVATVTDAQGNPVPNVSVAFVITGGTPTAARSKSDAAGRAMVTWTPATPGEQHVTAAVTGTHLSAVAAIRGTPLTTSRRKS